MNFQSKLEKGVFVVGECIKCKKIIWPPSEFCDRCFGNVDFRPSSKIGKILEFSKKGDSVFCVAEFEKDVRIIGALKNQKNPRIGQKVKIEKFHANNGKYSFELSSLEDQ